MAVTRFLDRQKAPFLLRLGIHVSSPHIFRFRSGSVAGHRLSTEI